MRAAAWLLCLCASVLPAADRASDDRSWVGSWRMRERDRPEPFLARTGVQCVAADSVLTGDGEAAHLGVAPAIRVHATALVLAGVPEPGVSVMLGLGGSHTELSAGGVAASLSCVDGVFGVSWVVPRDASWRIDVLGHAGFGWGMLGGSRDARGTERGVEISWTTPIIPRWQVDGSLSAGWHSLSMDAGSGDVVIDGSIHATRLRFAVNGAFAGCGISWRW